MSERRAWASNAMINPAMLRLITHSFDEGDRRKFASEARRRNEAGEPLGEDHFPPEVFVAEDSRVDYETLPDLFFAGAYWVVSGAVADVIRSGNMGHTGLYGTRVYRKDRKTPIGSDWFCLNFGNVKNAYVSGGEDPAPWKQYEGKQHKAPFILKDGQITLDGTAVSGPDIWVDKGIYNLFFVSDGLAKALKKAGVSGPFGLKKCLIA